MKFEPKSITGDKEGDYKMLNASFTMKVYKLLIFMHLTIGDAGEIETHY